jgi:diadenylate cyclase
MLAILLTGLFKIRFLDILDILLVAFILYELYNLLKGSVSINMLFAIVGMFFIWRITDALGMELLREILGAFFSVGIIALFIIFQPELRQFLLTLGKTDFIQKKKKRRFLFWHFSDVSLYIVDIDKIVHACQKMSNNKQGALIILTRQHDLKVIKDTGQYLNADISVELLENIFFPNSPLHDGAVLISGNRIEAARCILPVSRSPHQTSIGLRHRAAMGITEQSDAIAVVVSEQTGRISYAEGGKLTTNVQPAGLKDFLEEKLQNVAREPEILEAPAI